MYDLYKYLISLKSANQNGHISKTPNKMVTVVTDKEGNIRIEARDQRIIFINGTFLEYIERGSVTQINDKLCFVVNRHKYHYGGGKGYKKFRFDLKENGDLHAHNDISGVHLRYPNDISLNIKGICLLFALNTSFGYSGEVEQLEQVIVMSADTAFVATGCRKDRLFHPEIGMEIKEIICKPSKFTVIHRPREQN